MKAGRLKAEKELPKRHVYERYVRHCKIFIVL